MSFFAKSFTFAYAESFEVLYSSTGRAIEDFAKVEVENYPADNAVPEVWTEFKAQLPAGAKYFAIRHTSNDTYALFIDDIAFSAAPVLPADLALQGFNIYHNGEKASEATAEKSSALCEVKDNGSHEFRVSAVYNHGESRASEPVVVDVKGVNAIAEISEADGVTVTAENGTIIVTGAEARSVAIAGIDGRIRYNGRPGSTLRVCVEPGVYIVKAAAATFKVLVR
ncbi:MAG: choice-of-anchor J domain-containing protein [Muribaculaceae bacterium]|nr:choice-of-anchor J domain-containing protein [Muribaculaceae bacterium]